MKFYKLNTGDIFIYNDRKYMVTLDESREGNEAVALTGCPGLIEFFFRNAEVEKVNEYLEFKNSKIRKTKEEKK